MIKLITLITKLIVIALMTLLFGSCGHLINHKSIEGSGHVTTEKRIVEGDFKSVEVSNAIDLVIEQSDKTEIIVEADDNLQNEITTKVENGKLIIACDYNSFLDVSSKKVTVKMPVIEEIEASSASNVNSANTLKGQHIQLNSSSASAMHLTIEADDINCDSSSGSTIVVNGMALKLTISASSGSNIDAKRLEANDIIANASSGATIAIHPIVSLIAEASSGGNINYNSTPKSIQKNSNSGGNISQE
ncbi:head GIN domain-containing protein [Flavobacterium sp. 123]|uniref:head GIN domain-containing protein n=1 Tax=Flavobacterium sp. 123 TaxID=2135627 RepID=UPI000EB2B954|nr:head GIN domain-containing protein [Flavobacterium sp. 123]RKT00104.1 putative autotransporter adhesin-like protein [Flavobacterium sp. 123]